MHYFRSLDRKANEAVYQPGHAMHGSSVYDDFVVQIIKDIADEFWLYIQPRSAKVLAIEGLSDVEPIDVDGEEVLAIADQTNG